MKKLEKIIIRIIGFPFFMGLSIVFSILLCIKYMINYCKYGGEAISYTHENQNKTISDIYKKLEEHEKQNKKESDQ